MASQRPPNRTAGMTFKGERSDAPVDPSARYAEAPPEADIASFEPVTGHQVGVVRSWLHSLGLNVTRESEAAHVLENKMTGRMKGISCREVKQKVDAGEECFLLDNRGPAEHEQMRLGIGETLIPLGALRKRLAELPQDKDAEIICFCKISLRGYEAALVLEANGWRNVKVMEGGVMAWPFPREK